MTQQSTLGAFCSTVLFQFRGLSSPLPSLVLELLYIYFARWRWEGEVGGVEKKKICRAIQMSPFSAKAALCDQRMEGKLQRENTGTIVYIVHENSKRRVFFIPLVDDEK